MLGRRLVLDIEGRVITDIPVLLPRLLLVAVLSVCPVKLIDYTLLDAGLDPLLLFDHGGKRELEANP